VSLPGRFQGVAGASILSFERAGVMRRRSRRPGDHPAGQQTGSKRLKSSSLNHAESNPEKPASRMNRAIPPPSSSIVVPLEPACHTEARDRSLSRLLAKVQRVADAGQLGSTSVRDGAVAFNAMCEGLANSELRDTILRILPAGEEERAWRDSLTALVRGFNAS
jgi:hypothetical protein